MENKRLAALSLFLLWGCAALAQASLQQQISAAFTQLQTDAQVKYGTVSLTVLDAKTGEQIFTGNPDMGMAPASTMKTVTTITAYNMLGSSFTYQTPFGYTGTITDGTLNGDIIIKGSGDPTLGSWRYANTNRPAILNQLVSALKKAGITKINGRIIGDDSLYGTQAIPDGWIWQDMGTYYGAGVNALCWHENQFDINLRTGTVGSPVSVTGSTPTMPYLNFKSELTTGAAGTGDQAYPYLPTASSNLMYLRGTYAIDKAEKSVAAAIPDPAFDMAYRLFDTLKRLGIAINAMPESSLTLAAKNQPTPAIANNLLNITSPTLGQIVYWTNRKSVNLYAEELLKAMALKAGKSPTTNNAVEVLKNYWKSRGIDPGSMDVADGSGLSPANRITSLTIATIMQSTRKEAWFNEFYDSLPIYNDMHMKSGSIYHVLAYTGFVTHQGRELCFSIMVNNYNGSTSGVRGKMFRVLDVLK